LGAGLSTLTFTGSEPRIEFAGRPGPGWRALELDENFKRLIKELGHALDESLSESERIADVMSRIRSAGYDVFLVLEVTIGFNKRGEVNVVHRHKIQPDSPPNPEFRLTSQDTEFLRDLKIIVDEDLES